MAKTEVGTFHWADYVVFVLVLLISASIGIFYGLKGHKNKTTKEYLMAGRAMTVLPVTLSLLASFMSAITLLGTPSEMYQFGTQYWVIWVGYGIMIPLAAHVFLPIFFRLKLTSVLEYLEMRFNKPVRVATAIVYILQMVFYMSIVLYAPSLALNRVTGLHVYISVFSVGIVCTFYTALGGMKAVMWTDVFQICMMFAGLIAVLIQGSIDMGGFANIWRINYEGDRVGFFDFDPSPRKRHSVWALVFGGCFTWLAVYGVNQAQVQRALCTPRLRDGQLALWLNFPGLTALLTVCGLAGMVIYAQYHLCDPKSNNDVIAADQLLPFYVMHRLRVPGLPGLFTACLFSGALSTLSSGLNSLAAVTLQDLIKSLCFKDLSEEKATNVSRVLAAVYGVICLILTFVAEQLGDVLQAALALFGMIGGPILGLFTLGIIYPCANGKGAMVGLICGLLFTFWVGIGANVHKPYVYRPIVRTIGCPNDTFPASNASFFGNMTSMSTMTTMALDLTTSTPTERPEKSGILQFYEISYLWYSALGVGVVNFVGLAVSFMTGANNPTDVDPRLICPVFDIFCCCLPKNFRRILQCNMDHDIRDKDPGPGEDEKKKEINHIEANSFANEALEYPDDKSSYDVTRV